LECELFDVKVKHEINVTPMKEYIEELFRKALINITKENQETTISTSPKTARKEDKRTTMTPK